MPSVSGRADGARQLIRAAEHLHERTGTLAGEDSCRCIALGVIRIQQTIHACRVRLVGKAASEIKLLLDHRRGDIEIADGEDRIHVACGA